LSWFIDIGYFYPKLKNQKQIIVATRSRIAVELGNGTVKSVYCHNDGYVSGVGRALEHMGFTSTEECEEYIDEGDRSTTSLSYKEWRDENCPPQKHKSKEEYFAGDIEEYGYLFTKDCEWVVKVYGDRHIADL